MTTGISITHRDIKSVVTLERVVNKLLSGWFPFILKKKAVKIVVETTNDN